MAVAFYRRLRKNRGLAKVIQKLYHTSIYLKVACQIRVAFEYFKQLLIRFIWKFVKHVVSMYIYRFFVDKITNRQSFALNLISKNGPGIREFLKRPPIAYFYSATIAAPLYCHIAK